MRTVMVRSVTELRAIGAFRLLGDETERTRAA